MEFAIPKAIKAVELLSRTTRTVVVRGLRDGVPVVVKTPAAEIPTEREIARYRHEFELLRYVEGEGVVRAIELVEQAGRVHLVLEDIGGYSLESALREATMPVREALEIILRCAEVLARVHTAGVLHKDVNPSNLVWSRKRGVLQIIDLSIGSRLTRELSVPVAPEAIEGTLLYLAPEQTGRMARGVDHRADLYALGATAWRLLVGRPPFASVDPLSLVHAHLARSPEAPHTLRPDVPATLSRIVLKLMAKDPEERYQSATGLAADLRRCRDGDGAGELGRDDRPACFAVPDRLYGRDEQLAALRRAFDDARDRAGVVRVGGEGGMGKSALVHALRGPVLDAGGRFATGRFEMLRRDVPHLALVRALGGLLREILVGSTAELAAWGERFVSVLGRNLGLVTPSLPELARVVGDAGELPAIGPEEARNRARVAFASLVRAFATSRPLVLFLDDLQWADGASIEVIEFLASDPGLRGLLLVLGVRDDEIPIGHPLRRPWFEGDGVLRVSPRALEVADVAQLVADTCRCALGEAEGLARVLVEKTAGNPFFLRATLTRLHTDGAIVASARGWKWDLDAVRSLRPADNVVALMVETLRGLPEGAQTALRIAACAGQRFQLSTLSAALGLPSHEVATDLWPALAAGLVIPEGDAWLLARHQSSAEAGYHFAHDRVQEAASSLLAPDARVRVHLALGRVLRDRGEVSDTPDALFAAVGHLSLGLAAMTDAAERIHFASLCLDAGRRARASAAFDTASGLFESGIEALGDGRWEEHRALAMALAEASADAALLAGNTACMEARVDEVTAHARDVAEEIGVAITRVRARMAEGRMAEALAVADRILEPNGFAAPRSGDRRVELALWSLFVATLGERTPEQLVDLPAAEDPLIERLHVLRSIMAVAHAALRWRESATTILYDVWWQLRAGCTTGAGAFSWATFGVLLAHRGQVALALRYGELALALCEKMNRPDVRPRIMSVIDRYIRPYADTLGELVSRLRASVERALEVGDFNGMARLAIGADHFDFLAGTELGTLAPRLVQSARLLTRHGIRGVDAHDLVVTAVSVLRGAAPLPRGRPLFEGFSDIYAELPALTFELQLALVFDDRERALEIAERSCRALGTVVSGVFPLFFWTYAIVARVGAGRGGRALRRGLRVLRRWARHQPAACAYRFAWIAAARASAKGRLSEALESFDRAIDGARALGFRQDAAIIAEQAARFCEGEGRQRCARAYRAEALAGYRQWGAAAKVSQIVEAWPELAEAVDAPSRTASSTTDSPKGLDLETVLRASRALSREIELGALVRRLVELALENAGAERAWLLLSRGERWVLVAEARVGEASVQPDVEVDLDETAAFPVTILRAALRDREPLVLADAAVEWTAPRDPYVLRHAPRSVLCVPLLDRDTLSGILYFENNLAAGAFTPARIEVLRTLSGQMAVSLKNAELHGETVALKRAFERFVPKDFLDHLRRSSVVDVRLGDSVEKEMSVLFSDIRGFTTLVEGMTPEQNIEFINTYLGAMEPEILRHGGFVDSYIGDAIMALFDRGADGALAAGVEMLRALRRYNTTRAPRGLAPVSIGIGVNTGTLTLGTIGGENRIKCGVIGDCVNVASRVESLTKTYGIPLLTTGRSRASLADPSAFLMRAVDRVQVKGRTGVVELYEVYDADLAKLSDAKQRVAAEWDEGLALYYSRSFRGALARFEACVLALEGDVVAARFAARARRHAELAPPSDWTGVEALDPKQGSSGLT